MEKFKKVNVYEYVKEGLKSGVLVPFEAKKFAKVIAKQGVVGQKVISWTMDKNGNEVKEKVDTVKLDKETNKPGWILTKTDENCYPVIDKNGHLNQWIVEDSVFTAKYEIDPSQQDLYKAKGAPQIFVQIRENIILEQGGSEMKIAAGGYINITNVDDMYGISEKDYNDTYKKTDTEIKIKTLR